MDNRSTGKLLIKYHIIAIDKNTTMTLMTANYSTHCATLQEVQELDNLTVFSNQNRVTR